MQPKTGTSSSILYTMLAGIFIGIPVVILLSTRTVIGVDQLFNVYTILLLVCGIQVFFIRKKVNSGLFLGAYLLLGSTPLVMALLLAINTFIPWSESRNEKYRIESVESSGGTFLLVLENNAFGEDTGIRRFDPHDLAKAPERMTVTYTFRKGILGFDVVLKRKIE